MNRARAWNPRSGITQHIFGFARVSCSGGFGGSITQCLVANIWSAKASPATSSVTVRLAFFGFLQAATAGTATEAGGGAVYCVKDSGHGEIEAAIGSQHVGHFLIQNLPAPREVADVQKPRRPGEWTSSS